jgi:hypothetical protein
MYVLIFSKTFVRNISHSKKKWEKYNRSSCKVPVILVRFLMKSEFSQQTFEKYSNKKFHENPSSGSRVVLCGQTDGRTDGRIDMKKLIVAFRNFANAPKECDALLSWPR